MDKNQLIHEWLGKCWHEWQDVEPYSPVKPWKGRKCVKCPMHTAYNPSDNDGPKYDSADSPRRLLDEPIMKCIEQVGLENWGAILVEVLHLPTDSDNEYLDLGQTSQMTPVEICDAIIRAMGLGEKGDG